MPFPTNDKLPPEVRKRYSDRCQTVFRQAFNNAISERAGGAASETAAFRIAHSAANNCMGAKESNVGDKTMAVKFADGSDNVIEGIGIPFGGPFGGSDLDGERFTKGTDFALDWEISRPLFYNHMLDETVGRKQIGKVLEHEITDDGVWVKAQLDKRTRYYGMVKELIEQQALGFSSGAWPHLVKTASDGEIKEWPWWEMSLTPTPANPDAVVYSIKATDVLEDVRLSKPTDALDAAVKAAIAAVTNESEAEVPQGSAATATSEPRTERVRAEFKAWIAETADRAEFRAKSGRELSKRNLETLREAHRIIGELLERANKPTAEEQEANKAIYAEYLRTQARINGVPV